MKIITVLGTRPEIIRLSRIIPLLDTFCTHILVHTGQNFNKSLSDIFFEELKIRNPDYHIGVRADSAGEQIGNILCGCEKIFQSEKPDKILILGDTNSALCAFIAKRMGIPVYHMEAGNRCFDDRVPEEVNRRIIDHSSDILLPYTERSRMNLLLEGIESRRILVTGNPIHEVITYYDPEISCSQVIKNVNLKEHGYFLVTMHRSENVDNPDRLQNLLLSLNLIWEKYNLPVIVSTHPHTRERMNRISGSNHSKIEFLEPFGFFDFLALEKHAFVVISDSGTVQEECALLGIPNVTIRDTTERPETLERGLNILSGTNPESILRCIEIVTSNPGNGTVPEEYVFPSVSSTVGKIILGI
ncbi:MAG: UDP-N-acetylglucosamine 2-epimerase (non-hydrolyzing) [Methanospirillaceae archaeon]|nr:UDP-N-acetylglucosamine 2-epimerase (non-hydrolyzing) [Methanospirillaceae archaeon]